MLSLEKETVPLPRLMIVPRVCMKGREISIGVFPGVSAGWSSPLTPPSPTG